MAQGLKDENREKIFVAALDEFYDKGYKLAAMRSIVAKAQIPAGRNYLFRVQDKRRTAICRYPINMASPNEKNLYRSRTASA